MLISMMEMAAQVQKGKYAVGAFHAMNLEQTQGIIEAAVEERSPVIIALDEQAVMYAGLGAFLSMTRELAEDVPVSVSVLLDHVRDPVLVEKALAKGYTGILADLGDTDYEQAANMIVNARKLCAEQSAFFEVGIGVHGMNQKAALEAIKSIGDGLAPDSFSLSIGAEQKQAPLPELLELIKQISNLTDRISLAGAGSWPVDDQRYAVGLGIWKISVGTRINMAFTKGLKTYLEQNPDRVHPRSYLASARDSLGADVRECIRSFRTYTL
jgi:fructose/tagatose bisphosphate aldolase